LPDDHDVSGGLFTLFQMKQIATGIFGLLQSR